MNVLNKIALALILLVIVAQESVAQSVPPLERVLTIDFSHERIETVLSRIAKDVKITFSYNAAILDSRKEVTESFKEKTVREILEQLFKGTVTYKDRGSYIILMKATTPPLKTSSTSEVDIPLFIHGYIMNGSTGDKLSEVSIYDTKSLTAAISNQYGYFKLELEKPGNKNQIAISKRNFIDTVLTVTRNNAGFITILLHPEQTPPTDLIVSSDTSLISIDTTHRVPYPEPVETEEPLNEGQINVRNIQDTLYRNFQASLLPFVGTNKNLSGNVVNGFSFNLLGGYSFGTKNMEVGGLFNMDRGNVSAFQLAGIFNMNGGSMTGFQAAGLYNVNRKGLSGAQFAGLANVNGDSVQGAHFAGLANVNTGPMSGAQFAGLANVQLGNFKGSQFAGLVNISTRKVSGTQVAGLMNYGKNIKGLQIGFLNIADTLHGVPIGFFSYVSKGYHKLEFFADEIFYTNIAFRTGTNKFYNILTFGLKPETDKDDNDVEWTFGYGIGTAPRVLNWLYLNFDISTSQLSKGEFTDAINLLNKAYLGLEVQPAKKFSVALGITLNGYLTRTTYENYYDIFTDYKPRIILDHNYNNDLNLKMWWGFKAGVRFF